MAEEDDVLWPHCLKKQHGEKVVTEDGRQAAKG